MPSEPVDLERLRKSATFYASFDEAVAGDYGGGSLVAGTRFGKPGESATYRFEKGFHSEVFRIAPGKGISGGALEALDVLPENGRIYFPAEGNIGYKHNGWGGAFSLWCNTDPNQLLKTSFCDPIQITEKGANNGGLWFDFNNERPRDMRHGAFPGEAEGHPAFKETDANAPMVKVPKIEWKSGEWHHVVMNWKRFDTGRPDGESAIYIDGREAGKIGPRNLAMRWSVAKAGLYVAVNYIGLLDEMAVFDRPLTDEEIATLRTKPDVLAVLKKRP